MFAFNRNNDKFREEMILIGFQVRPKGRTGYNSSNIQNHEVFTSKYAKLIHENLPFQVLDKTRKVKKEQLRKQLEILVPGGEVFSDKKGDKNE